MSEDKPEYLTDVLEMMGIVEPKQIITEVSGFIPVFEVVLHHYKDYMTALVFGRMWQYCGMSDGVCKASLERIGKDIEVSAVTVMRHAEKLVADGYLIDTTPDRRNAPHVYMDGRKVEMKSRFSAGMTINKATVINSKPTVINSQLIKQDNTNIKQLAAGAAKPDLLDGELHYNLKPTSIRQAMKEYFKLNVNWETKTARQWMEWAVGENITPEQVERAADLWRSDKQFNWQVPTLKGIFEKWDLLMEARKTDSPQRTEGVSSGYYA